MNAKLKGSILPSLEKSTTSVEPKVSNEYSNKAMCPLYGDEKLDTDIPQVAFSVPAKDYKESS